MHNIKTMHKIIALACSIMMLGPDIIVAAELEYPKSCYSGAELVQVREWEKTWVGRKISSADVDSVKEFLPESLYDTLKDVTKWGSHWFLIVPYQQITLTPGCIKFTKQYYGQPKIGSQGELINWISGYPFPDTTVGIEIAHNARCRTGGDAYISRQDGWTTDGRLKYDMASLIHSNYNYYAARWDTPPTPEILPNPKQIWRAFTLLQLDPPETRNMRIMEVQYKDQLKPYDSWMWLPTIRRVRRRSTSERQDPQGGSDYCSYDNSGWDGPVQINKVLPERVWVSPRCSNS